MMLHRVWILALVAHQVPTLLSAQGSTSSAIAMAAPGQRVSGVAWARDPRAWVALVRQGTGSRLESVAARAVPVQDPCSGSDTTVVLDRVIDGEVLVLLGGGGLKVGPIETAWPQPRFLYPGEMVSLRLGAHEWFILNAYGRAEPGAYDTFVEDYRLLLSHESTKDTIAAFPRFGLEASPQVRWAGDLDRDGRLDLLADLRRDYGGNRLVLFLSSGAGPGHLVRVVGHLDLPAC